MERFTRQSRAIDGEGKHEVERLGKGHETLDSDNSK